MAVRILLLIFLLLNPLLVFAGSQQTSSTLGSEMISDARADYGDSTTTYFSAAEMLQYLNDGMLEIASKTHCMEQTESVNLVADTLEYSITTNYIKIIHVVYNPASGVSKGLQRGDVRHVGKVQGSAFSDSTVPSFWYEFNGKIGIYPTLSSVTTETATLYIAERPTSITAGQNITLPAIYDNALKAYILYRMSLKDKNMELASRYKTQYEVELGIYRVDLQGDNENK